MISAKTSSHIAMMIAVLWVGTLTILKGLKIITLEIQDIIFSGGTIAAVFSPTFVSIWLDKIKDIKWGNK
jgi:hypothetical protein